MNYSNENCNNSRSQVTDQFIRGINDNKQVLSNTQKKNERYLTIFFILIQQQYKRERDRYICILCYSKIYTILYSSQKYEIIIKIQKKTLSYFFFHIFFFVLKKQNKKISEIKVRVCMH